MKTNSAAGIYEGLRWV